jgi:hypothetical protein
MRKIADSREAKDQHSHVEGSGTAIMVSVAAGLYVSGNPSLLKAKDDSEAGKRLQELCGAITGDRKQRRREHDRDRSIGARRQAVDAGSHDVHWAARVEWRSPAGYGGRSMLANDLLGQLATPKAKKTARRRSFGIACWLKNSASIDVSVTAAEANLARPTITATAADSSGFRLCK